MLDKVKLVTEISAHQKTWRNDERIWKWCRQNHELWDHNMEGWAKRIQADDIEMFGIAIEDVNNLNVGTCGLTSISRNHRTAEFSLFVSPDFQGNGYGKAALLHLLYYGFNRLNLQCIWGETMEGNPAVKLFEKVGFRVQSDMCRRRYFKHGKYIGSYQLDILAEEFNKLWAKDLKTAYSL